MLEPAYICGALYRPSRRGPERTWPSYAAIANVLSAVVSFHLFYEKWVLGMQLRAQLPPSSPVRPREEGFTRKL